MRLSTNHLKPTGTSSIGRLRPLATRSMHGGGDEGLPAPTFADQPGRWVKKVLDADGEIVVGVEEAGGAGDDAVAVVVGVGGGVAAVLFFIGDHGLAMA